MFNRLFGGGDKGADPKAAPVVSPAATTPSGAASSDPSTAASHRVMKDCAVVANGRELPRFERVMTDRGQRYAVREEDHQHVALLDLGAGEYAIVWGNTLAAKPAFDALLTRVRQDGIGVRRLYEASPEVMALLYRPVGEAVKAVERIETGRSEIENEIDAIITDAVRLRASDIHINVDERTAVIRLRVHGSLEDYSQLRADKAFVMANALHAMADEQSKQTAFSPHTYQDASITKTLSVDGIVRHLKLRFASLKCNNGFDIVMRVLYQESSGIAGTLLDLGYDEDQIYDFDRMLGRPQGLVALCGTTGSGKSTTTAKLLEMLHERHQGTRLIRSIEDPVEYIIPGARQHVIVRSDGEGAEDGFLKAFKACMRADPDILSVGECRDHATADLLQHAVQSGHKVFATVHASNPFEAIFRLIHMGVGRSDIASDDFISGIVYQRLLRVMCPDCSVPMIQSQGSVSADLRRRIIRLAMEDMQAIRVPGEGCATCRRQKFIGRTVAAEMLVPDREILQHILRDDRLLAKAYWRAGLSEYDKSKSGRTALDQAIQKMGQGLVSPMDVEKEIGPLDGQRSPEEELAWYRKASRQRDNEILEERGGK